MATVMDRHHPQYLSTPRTVTQKVCIGLGIVFIAGGVGGIFMPGMLGMHLSLAHNIIHMASGLLALWSGYADDNRRAYNFSLAFGFIYALLGIAGYVFGVPGVPGVGNMTADQNLLRVIPNALEFGTNDHALHFLLGAFFLSSALFWKNRPAETGRNLGESKRLNRPGPQRGFKETSPGQTNLKRPEDRSRKSEIERRV